MNEYSDKHRWALFGLRLRSDILRLKNADGSRYLTRFPLLRTPWFSVYLHFLYGPDLGSCLHDHPWDFFSLVLRGWYWEQVPTDPDRPLADAKLRLVDLWNVKRATELHRIVALSECSPVITLIVTGRRRRGWGFVTPTGWIPWDKAPKGVLAELA